MKRNERKIIGIGAIVLMILVVIAPAINGLQQNAEKTLILTSGVRRNISK